MTGATNRSGGAAAAGGFGFQARLGAIAGIHVLRGTPVQWTDGLTGAAPCAVDFETSGPGDDLSLRLTDGSRVELQAKKGLRADGRFWSALDALCEGIHGDRCNFGILIVCPNSSATVRQAYSLALERIGDGRNDDASREQVKLASRLAAKAYDAEAICACIRIRTVSALEDAGDAIAAARAELARVCADDRQVTLAWNVLCEDSLSATTRKGRRTLRSLSARLRASAIDIVENLKDSPVSISDRLLRWTMSRTEQFEALGIPRPLPMDQGWLALKAVVRDSSVRQNSTAEQALADYRALGEKPRADEEVIDANTIGTFRRLCVVVGGPGSGKSLLLRVLAREFAKESYVSIRVRLRDLATRMQETGCGVEEGLLQLGVDGAGVTREQVCAAHLSELVLLCDGLDECGARQLDIVSGLKDISASHPSYRIVVTTRPIGFSTSELYDWRHYEIVPLAEADTAEHLATLCQCALDKDSAEERDELLLRIRAYLQEGNATRILARSPLLLAFGAALFLNWREPSKTKLELYQRIFSLIDCAPVRRGTGRESPAKAIRDSILNQLGWLTSALPLLPAEEIERRCAQAVEQNLGVTRLRALAMVESSIGYWEEKGLIERLRHSGIDLIAFIHKTCGEFAAARHLSEIESDEARDAIASVLSNPDWDEILDFATGTPLATMLAEMLVVEFKTEEAGESNLNRLFRVLVRPETSLQPAERNSFLKRVFALAQFEDRQKAYRVGLCLTKHDLSGMPEAEQMAEALLTAPVEWSRLVGWAALVCHFPGSVNRSALEDALVQFMARSTSNDFFVHHKWIRPLGPLPDRGLFENFLVGALAILLPDQDAEYQDRMIDDVWKSQQNATMDFVLRFESLLRQLGREDISMPPFRSARFLRAQFADALKNSVPGKFEACYTALLTEVVPTAFVGEDTDVFISANPKCLAALFEMAGIMRVPAPDVYVWQSEDTRLDAVHALLRAAAYIYDLPAEKLAAEARQVITIGESLHDDRQVIRFMDILPKVDVPEVDWSRSRDCDIEMNLVEGLVHHPSQWVQRFAAQFMNERLTGGTRRSACERMLATGTGDTLHWAAALTAELADNCEVLVRRLEGPDATGLHHLFDNLKEQGCIIARSHLAVLEKGLLNLGAMTAVSAARWCEASASSGDTWLVDLLRTASRYWVENEEPYPSEGGVIPDSPREALLRTLCRICPPPYKGLVKLAGDRRGDVKNAAIDGIVGLAKESSTEKSRLVDSIMAKQFSVGQCEKLLDGSIPYRTEELSNLCNLSVDQDYTYRLIAVRRVLTHPGVDRDEALAIAQAMKGDENGNVRDAVYQFLDRVTG